LVCLTTQWLKNLFLYPACSDFVLSTETVKGQGN